MFNLKPKGSWTNRGQIMPSQTPIAANGWPQSDGAPAKSAMSRLTSIDTDGGWLKDSTIQPNPLGTGKQARKCPDFI